MSEAFNEFLIDVELQVRLMNLVMGEASDFERDQLQLLMEQRSELAAYYRHLEHLHGLLCVVGAGDPIMDGEAIAANDSWKLSPDRRSRLLAVLDNRGLTPSESLLVANEKGRKFWRIRGPELAVGALVACVILGLFLPAVQSSREAARSVAARNSARDLADATTAFQMDDSGPKMSLPAKPGAPNSKGVADATTWTDAPNRSAAGRFSQNGEVSDFERKPASGYPAIPYGMAAPSVASSPNIANDEPAQIVTVPDTDQDGRPQSVAIGGTVLLGGIERQTNGANASEYDVASASPMLVSPRIIVDEAEEPLLLGRSPNGREAEEGWKRRSASVPQRELKEEESARTTGSKDIRGREWSLGSLAASEPAPGLEALTMPQLEASQNVVVPQKPEGQQLFRDEQVEFIEDLDLVIIKGAQKDTERTLEQIQVLKGKNAAADLKSSTAPNDKSPTGDKAKKLDSSLRTEVTAEESAGKDPQQAQLEFFGTMTDGRLSDGEVAARKAGSPAQSQVTEWEKQNATPTGRPAESDILRYGKADNYIDLTNSAGQSAVASQPSPSATTWEAKRQADIHSWRYVPAPAPEAVSSSRDRIEDDRKYVAPQKVQALEEQSAATEAFSTFSLHVSDVSFKLAQTALAQGQWPEAAKIRIEEFVNALDYHDPLPSASDKVACRIEQAMHPFLMQRNLLRVSMRTAATGRSQNVPLRLTLLLDNSGSMERPDRREAVLRAFRSLTSQLTAADQVTLISFASTPRLLADKVPGSEGARLLKLVEQLPSEGGTNIEAALLLAREKAVEQQLVNAQNRIVLLTDGAVNLGNANPESLAKIVIQLRDSGIAFDAAGISAVDLNDEVLEALTRQGDGRYYLLNSVEAVDENFVAQIAGALRPSAQNVKVQVEFNPQRVGRYKLLGFEKHRLNKEDFRNDKVDAAEMAAAEAGVAVYQYEVKANGSGDVGSVSVRFRDLTSGQMVERRWPIPYEFNTPRLEQAEPSMQLAATAALLAAKLAGGPLADSVDLAQLQQLLANLSTQYSGQPRVQQLRAMIDQAKSISGK